MATTRSQIGTSEAGSLVAIFALKFSYFTLKEYMDLHFCVKQLGSHL